MTFPIHQSWQLSTEFYEARPLSQPAHKRKHPHGAWDCACPIGTPILAPENGELGIYIAYRPEDGMYFKRSRAHKDFYCPFRNYFYDTFGLLYILRGDSGLSHVFAHSYHPNQNLEWSIVEEQPAKIARRPLLAYQAKPQRVYEKNMIGSVGNAGWSTGPHLHYEIHENPWERWEHRPDPAAIYSAEWEKHKNELRYNWKQAKKLWN